MWAYVLEEVTEFGTIEFHQIFHFNLSSSSSQSIQKKEVKVDVFDTVPQY